MAVCYNKNTKEIITNYFKKEIKNKRKMGMF